MMEFIDLDREHRRANLVFDKDIARERLNLSSQENKVCRIFKLNRWFRTIGWFAGLMKAKLSAVAHKRDWRGTGLNYRVHRMRQEFLEAMEAYERYREYARAPLHDETTALQLQEAFIDELTDVGITAMMAADYFREHRWKS